jgi:hypothetical protein
MKSANERIQQSLDRALEIATGLDFLNPAAYSQDPETPEDPALGAEMVAQPARHKGLGIRRIDGFVGSAAYIGGMELVSRRLIDKRGKDGSVQAGLYPLLEPLFGAGSQDHGNENQRFAKLTDGSSTI